MTTVLITVLILGFIILVHELGHFLAARRAGVHCHEFSIGFGPGLHSWSDGETQFSIRLIPLGGYVLMAGEIPSPAEESGDPSYPPVPEEKKFPNKSILVRMGIIAAGPITNFLLATVVFFIIFGVVGLPVPTTTVHMVEPQLPAEQAGLQQGDDIVAIDGQEVHAWEDIAGMIAESEPGEQIHVQYERVDRVEETTVNITESPHEEGVGYVGLQPTTQPDRQPLLQAAGEAIAWTGIVIVMLAEVFIDLLGGQTEALLGVVGVGAEVGRAAEMGLANVLWTVAAISSSIGFFQLLPIPALDGSRILFLLVEKIRGEPIDPEKEGLINFLGFAFLIALVIYVTFQDISRLIG